MSGAPTAETVCRIIASVLPKAGARGGVTPSMSLQGDLGIDSMGLMSIVFLIEEETGVDTMSNFERFVAAEHVSDIVAVVLDP